MLIPQMIQCLEKKALNKSKENCKKSEKKDGFQSKHNNTSFTTNINKSSKPRFSNGARVYKRQQRLPTMYNLSHDLDDCELFYKKTKEQRKEVLKEKKLCFACYGKTIFHSAVLEREGVKMQQATSFCSPLPAINFDARKNLWIFGHQFGRLAVYTSFKLAVERDVERLTFASGSR